MSLPAWGVWIEIKIRYPETPLSNRRSPHGECGLKLTTQRAKSLTILSLPAWGVWIEICRYQLLLFQPLSLPAWGVWIEMWYELD